MRKTVSPPFLAAVVVGLSFFFLLSLMFYTPADYFERSEVVAESGYGGLRFLVASLLYKPFGVAAYIGTLIVLTWGVVVYFRERVGDVAIRTASLAVAMLSGAAVAQILGDRHLGGNVGYAFGSIFESTFGAPLGTILMGGIFLTAFLFATDFGFIRYFREARSALAEPETFGADENDLVKIIERTASEVEGEAETAAEPAPAPAVEEAAPALKLPPEVVHRGEGRPLVLDLKPRIEEETLDEDLLVAGREPEGRTLVREDGGRIARVEIETLIDEEDPPAVEVEEAPIAAAPVEEAVETPPAAAVETEAEPEIEAAWETVPEAAASPSFEFSAGETAAESAPAARRDSRRDLDSVFDALVGAFPPPAAAPAAPAAPLRAAASAQPEPIVEAGPAWVLDDEIVFYRAEETSGAAEEPAEAAAPAESGGAATAVAEEEAPRPADAPVEAPSFFLDDSLPGAAPAGVAIEEAAPEAPAVDDPAPITEEIPVLKDVRDVMEVVESVEVEEEPGLFRSLFRKKKGGEAPERDPLLPEAARIVFDRGRASVVLLQRRLDVGYTRASRIIEAMEREGLVGPLEESGSRPVLLTPEEWERRIG